MFVTRPRVALLVETSHEYGRAMLRGIVKYARLHGSWTFYITPGDYRQSLPELTEGSGIIARVETVEVAKGILTTGLPAVLLDPDPIILMQVPELANYSVVDSDSEGAARMCAKHLLECGFRNFAFVGLRNRIWSARRMSAFCAAIRDAGFQAHVYPVPVDKTDSVWEREQLLLTCWIRELPTPIGIMACNDDRGRNVLEACRLAGLHVPVQVAVIGIDNDEFFCELSEPPLSSVSLNAEHGGYRTAQLLDQLMSKSIDSVQRMIVEPVEVVTRRSTDVRVIEDREVALVMSFIHHNRSRNCSVNEVADQIGMSRRNLEIKFRRATGKTILAEVQRVRLNHAERMLRETNLPIPQVAKSSGYRSANYFSKVFHKEIGTTPAKYRAEHRR